MYPFFGLAYFTWQNYFDIHSRCNMYITSSFLSTAGRGILFYCMDIPCSLRDGHSGLFQVLIITTKAAMNIQVLIFLETDAVFSLRYLGVEWLGHVICICLTL